MEAPLPQISTAARTAAKPRRTSPWVIWDGGGGGGGGGDGGGGDGAAEDVGFGAGDAAVDAAGEAAVLEAAEASTFDGSSPVPLNAPVTPSSSADPTLATTTMHTTAAATTPKTDNTSSFCEFSSPSVTSSATTNAQANAKSPYQPVPNAGFELLAVDLPLVPALSAEDLATMLEQAEQTVFKSNATIDLPSTTRSALFGLRWLAAAAASGCAAATASAAAAAEADASSDDGDGKSDGVGEAIVTPTLVGKLLGLIQSPVVAVCEAAGTVLWILAASNKATVALLVHCGVVDELLLAIAIRSQPSSTLARRRSVTIESSASQQQQAQQQNGQVVPIAFATIARVLMHVSAHSRYTDSGLLSLVVRPLIGALKSIRELCEHGNPSATAAISVIRALAEAGFAENVVEQGFIAVLLNAMNNKGVSVVVREEAAATVARLCKTEEGWLSIVEGNTVSESLKAYMATALADTQADGSPEVRAAAVCLLRNVLISKNLKTKVSPSLRNIYAISSLTIPTLVPAVIKGVESEAFGTACMEDLLTIVEHLCLVEFSSKFLGEHSRSPRKSSGGDVFSQEFAKNGGLEALVGVLKAGAASPEVALDPQLVLVLLSTIDRIRLASKRPSQQQAWAAKSSRETTACRSRAVKILARSLREDDPACTKALECILEVLNQAPLEALSVIDICGGPVCALLQCDVGKNPPAVQSTALKLVRALASAHGDGAASLFKSGCAPGIVAVLKQANVLGQAHSDLCVNGLAVARQLATMAPGASEALIAGGIIEQANKLLGMLDPVPIELQESVTAVFKALNFSPSSATGSGSSNSGGGGGGSSGSGSGEGRTDRGDRMLSSPTKSDRPISGRRWLGGQSGRRSVSLSDMHRKDDGGGSGKDRDGNVPTRASSAANSSSSSSNGGSSGATLSSPSSASSLSSSSKSSSSSKKGVRRVSSGHMPPACAGVAVPKLTLLKQSLAKVEQESPWLLGQDL